MDNIKLKEILSNIELKEVEYRGINWKIGDYFFWNEGNDRMSDKIQRIKILHFTNTQSKIYDTELRLIGQVYGVNINKCYKLKY